MHGVRSCALIYHQSVKKKWNFMSFHKPFQHCCNCSSCTIHNHFRCRVPSAQLSGSLEKTFLRLVQSKTLQFGDVFYKVRAPGLGKTTITVQQAAAATTVKSRWDWGLAGLTPYGSDAFFYTMSMIWEIFWGNDQGKKLWLTHEIQKKLSICPLKSWAKQRLCRISQN